MIRPAPRRLPRAIALLSALVATAALPTAARADISIDSFKAGPVPTYNSNTGLPLTGAPNPSFDAGCAYGTPGATSINTSNPDRPLTLATQAGANTDYCVAFRLGTGDAVTGEDLKDTLVQLPVGSYAEIDRAAKCSVAAFARESTAPAQCPVNTQVGTALAQLQIAPTFVAPGPPPVPNTNNTRITQDAPGRIYALDTPSDKAALLGVALVGSNPPGTAETKFIISVSQQGEPSVGLLNQTDTLAKVLAQQQNSQIAIRANALRFWGKAAEHTHVGATFAPPAGTPAANFFRIGTTCFTPQVTNLTVNPYTDVNTTSKPTTASSTPYFLTGCDGLKFDPTFSATLAGETTPGGHPALNVSITSPEGDEDLQGTTIALPLGVGTDLKRIQGACPAATFRSGGCGDATVIGTVKATLSGINDDVVTGVIHKVQVDGQQLPALGLDFKGRLPLRISGITTIDSAGRILSTFTNLPSIPQRSLSISLYGGDRGILQVGTGKCTASGYSATLRGQNGKTKSFFTPTVCPEQLSAELQNADSRRPALFIRGAGATGKKIETLRVTLPAGLTINRNRTTSGVKFDKFDAGTTGAGRALRLDKKTLKLRVPKPGTSGLRVITRTGTLGASAKFASRSTAIEASVRIVYTNGTKATLKLPITRKD